MIDSAEPEVVASSDADRLLHEPATLCLNCGCVLPGRYCPECGQRDQPLQQPASVFIKESVSEYFGLDGRLWRSLGLLLFRPGALTEAYLEGQRTRYLRPLRLYLTATLGFFFTVSLLNSPSVGRAGGAYGGLPADTLMRASDLESHLKAGAEAATSQQDMLDGMVAGFGRRGEAGHVAAQTLQTQADSLESLAEELTSEASRVDDLPSDSLITPADLTERAQAYVADSIGVVSSGQPMVGTDLPDMIDRLPDWAKGGLARRYEAAETEVERQVIVEQYRRAMVGQIPTALFLVLPLFALLLKGVYATGGGRRARVRLVPRRPAAGASAWQRVRFEVRTLGVRWDRWRHHRAVRARRTKRERARRRLVRGALRRTAAAVRSHAILRPWRQRRLAVLRRSLRSRRTRYYAEHLVFALHVHAFTFCIFLLLSLVGTVWSATSPVDGIVPTALTVSIPLYFVVAQHRVYAESWPRTVWKAFALGLPYTILIALGTVVAAALAFRFS